MKKIFSVQILVSVPVQLFPIQMCQCQYFLLKFRFLLTQFYSSLIRHVKAGVRQAKNVSVRAFHSMLLYFHALYISKFSATAAKELKPWTSMPMILTPLTCMLWAAAAAFCLFCSTSCCWSCCCKDWIWSSWDFCWASCSLWSTSCFSRSCCCCCRT